MALSGISYMENADPSHIIVIGASAGGFTAISRLVASLEDNLQAAIFVVLHTSLHSDAEVIREMLQEHTIMHCKVAEHGEAITMGCIYIASADRHMLIDEGKILIQKGAYENHYRPSIDVLFRSAAATYGACVTGIILSGIPDDGTSGMYAIKRSGGICIVQDPAEAEFPNMPLNVINNVQVDYQIPAAEMGRLLTRLLPGKPCDKGEIPDAVKLEAQITRRMSTNPEDMRKLGPPTDLTCPDCGGTLHRIQEDVIPRYRCYTGHSYTASSLEDLQLMRLEESLWTAIRMMEERRNLLFSIPDSSRQKVEKAEELDVHVSRLKAMLQTLNKGGA